MSPLIAVLSSYQRDCSERSTTKGNLKKNKIFQIITFFHVSVF